MSNKPAVMQATAMLAPGVLTLAGFFVFIEWKYAPLIVLFGLMVWVAWLIMFAAVGPLPLERSGRELRKDANYWKIYGRKP